MFNQAGQLLNHSLSEMLIKEGGELGFGQYARAVFVMQQEFVC